MRFSCLSTVIPGSGPGRKCALAARAGLAGLETIVFPHGEWQAGLAEWRRACAGAGLELAVVIVGGLDLTNSRGVEWARAAMAAIRDAGAAALITPEYRPQSPLPLFPPHARPAPERVRRVEEAVFELVENAAQLGVRLVGEPLTPFESELWREAGTVLDLCRRVNSPWFRVALDTHNLLYTEAGSAETIKAAGDWLGHVHLADSNRRLPGAGQIDFAPICAALRAIDYRGWCSFECTPAPAGVAVENLDPELFVARMAGCVERLSVLSKAPPQPA